LGLQIYGWIIRFSKHTLLLFYILSLSYWYNGKYFLKCLDMRTEILDF